MQNKDKIKIELLKLYETYKKLEKNVSKELHDKKDINLTIKNTVTKLEKIILLLEK